MIVILLKWTAKITPATIGRIEQVQKSQGLFPAFVNLFIKTITRIVPAEIEPVMSPKLNDDPYSSIMQTLSRVEER